MYKILFTWRKISSLCLIYFVFSCLILYAETDNSAHLERRSPVVRAVSETLPSVVNIGTERVIATSYSPWGDCDPFDRLFRDFFAEQGEVKTFSLGSGSIIDEEGLVISNSHVVRRASKINILLESGESFTAKMIAGDDINDIALLKIIPDKTERRFKPIKFSNPDELYLGEQVIAVGNPYGLGHSISCGVLSAIGRKATYQGVVIFSDILQTDAAINPGNSGGPLVNINAEMIGMNLSMFKDAQGIGFAIPLKRIESILAKWLIPERFNDVTLGLIPGYAEDNKKPSQVIAAEVIENSPAWNAGIRPGEKILEINSQKINSLIDAGRILWKLKGGEKIKITSSKSNYEIEVLKTKPLSGAELASAKLGLGLQELTPQLAEAMDYPFEGGLIVNDNKTNIKNVARGDIFLRLGDIPINTFEDIPRALQNVPIGEELPAVFGSIIRKGKKYYLLRKQTFIVVK